MHKNIDNNKIIPCNISQWFSSKLASSESVHTHTLSMRLLSELKLTQAVVNRSLEPTQIRIGLVKNKTEKNKI